MRKFSKEIILREWNYWTNKDPNKDMNKGGYSVCISNISNDKYSDCNYAEVESSERIFKTKEESWLHFEKDICEFGVTGRDFWGGIWWDDKGVASTHYDEGGSSMVWIEKWEGFDDDIQTSWEYKGVKYKSLEDLWETEPIFNGCYMETDRPWIIPKDWRPGDDAAKLDITLSESFEKSCKEKEKELEDEKKKRKERIEMEEKEWAAKAMNFDGLPF